MVEVNKELEEVIRMKEEVIKLSKDNNINLFRAIYKYFEIGNGSSHSWWKKSEEEKINILENLSDKLSLTSKEKEKINSTFVKDKKLLNKTKENWFLEEIKQIVTGIIHGKYQSINRIKDKDKNYFSSI